MSHDLLCILILLLRKKLFTDFKDYKANVLYLCIIILNL